MLGRANESRVISQPQVRTFADYNRDRYWSLTKSIPKATKIAKLFPIADMFSGDSDIISSQDAFAVMHDQMGVNAPMGTTPAGWDGFVTGGNSPLGVGGEFRKGPLSRWNTTQVVACYTKNSSCTMHDYCTVNATNDELVNASDIARLTAAAFNKTLNKNLPTATQVAMSAMADEPGWHAPLDIPVATSTIVKARWQTYLQTQHLTPTDFGKTNWDDVVPNSGRGDAGAGSTSSATSVAMLPNRKLFYWSIRFAHWDSCRYFAEWTAGFQKAANDPKFPLYVNWNNFDGRMYAPGAGPWGSSAAESPNTGQMSYDWFEWARMKGGSMLWCV
jgi:hypothetical protein